MHVFLWLLAAIAVLTISTAFLCLFDLHRQHASKYTDEDESLDYQLGAESDLGFYSHREDPDRLSNEVLSLMDSETVPRANTK